MNDTITTSDPRITLRFATADDAGLILDFIRQLAEYENLTHEMVTDERIHLVGRSEFFSGKFQEELRSIRSTLERGSMEA